MMGKSSFDSDLWRAVVRDVVPMSRKVVVQTPTAPLTLTPPARRSADPMLDSHTLDLHGVTLAAAHAILTEFIAATAKRYRVATVITGMSGAIRREFPHWTESDSNIHKVEAMNGGGAFLLHYRRR